MVTTLSYVNKLGTEKISKLFIAMTIPTVIAQVVNLLYNIVDRIYIGHIPDVGSVALTGAGLFMPLVMLTNAFAALIGSGGAPIASMQLGKQDMKQAERVMNVAFSLLLMIAVVLTILLYWNAPKLLTFFGASAKTLPYALAYGRTYILGSVFALLTMGLNVFITAQGHSRYAMMTIIIGATTNIILDPIFIFLLGMGVRGAAIATIISQGISACWIIYFLTHKKSAMKLALFKPRIDTKIARAIVGLGSSIFVMLATESLLSITFNHSLANFGGDIAVGAMTIITSTCSLLFMPISGISQGGTPILSYNYGADNKARVKEGFSFLIKSSLTYTLIFWSLVMLAPRLVAHMFTSNAELLDYTVHGMRVYFLGIFALGIQIPCQQSFVAMNQAKVSLLLAILRKLILLIPLIIILPYFFEDKVFAVFLAEPVSDILAASITFTMFYKWFKGYLHGHGKHFSKLL